MPKGHPLPKAIKYLCDFLDVQAADLSQHDPDTLHTWKTNRVVAATMYVHASLPSLPSPHRASLHISFSPLFLLLLLLYSFPSAHTTLCTHGRPTGTAQQLDALLLDSSPFRFFLPLCTAVLHPCPFFSCPSYLSESSCAFVCSRPFKKLKQLFPSSFSPFSSLLLPLLRPTLSFLLSFLYPAFL